MKSLVACAAIVLAVASVSTAEAKGCIKGALAGGIAGHYAGHHAILGAAAGCAIGRHEAKKRAQMRETRPQDPDRDARDLRDGSQRL